jgi:hypothetical protein
MTRTRCGPCSSAMLRTALTLITFLKTSEDRWSDKGDAQRGPQWKRIKKPSRSKSAGA